ncbi:MAG: hypothetical protein KAU10_08880, partial [Dehalococcoidia bacterium]|nr:hypothetical protein [Dehalococcoidia bacterium]
SGCSFLSAVPAQAERNYGMRPRNSHVADKLRRYRAKAALEGLLRSVGACTRRWPVRPMVE